MRGRVGVRHKLIVSVSRDVASHLAGRSWLRQNYAVAFFGDYASYLNGVAATLVKSQPTLSRSWRIVDSRLASIEAGYLQILCIVALGSSPECRAESISDWLTSAI
jgi:hypothetical protein